MSQFYLFRCQHDDALAEIERAVAMDPNCYVSNYVIL